MISVTSLGMFQFTVAWIIVSIARGAEPELATNQEENGGPERVTDLTN